MKCDSCGKTCRIVVGKLSNSDFSIGTYELDNAKYYECTICGEKYYPLITAMLLDEKREEILVSFIKKRPISDFISATETAALLGITRQALNENRRIKKGFIYQTKISGKKVYLKESVELFKNKGDGRFLLNSLNSLNRNNSGKLTEKQKPIKYCRGPAPNAYG